MREETRTPIPGDDELLFLPLGGVGEIGMNLSLYGHDGQWLMVDLGITFGGDAFPNYGVMTPDPDFIERRRDRLVGLVLTHAHEDHLGAVPHLWRRLRCPVFATPFTAAVLAQKLGRVGLSEQVPLNLVGQGERRRIGAFDVEFVTVTHSIPEPNALVIRTAAGALYHSGDWKLDEHPTLGLPYDRGRFRQLGREPLLGMVCDSTNALVPGRSGSEGELERSLTGLIDGCPGRVVATCFASNLARLNTFARIAVATGRRFGVLGQSLKRMLAVAKATGYWDPGLPELVDGRDLGYLPREEVLAVCTGSQGEPKAALARLALNAHPDLPIGPGDTVIFSSRTIPGNEVSVGRVRQQLVEQGARVLGAEEARVHVSGHPARDELAQLYEWIRPPVVIPAHGTPRHLDANAAVAARCHVPRCLVGRNGNVFRMAPGQAEVIAQVPVGRLVVRDGYTEPVQSEVVRRMQEAGR